MLQPRLGVNSSANASALRNNPFHLLVALVLLLKGVKPSRELCQQIKVGQQTWAAYLGLLKHGEAWLCLREALDKVVKNRYLLHPRFQLNPRSGRWEYMDPNLVSQIVYQQGWKGLAGTIEPDIVILDANGVIILVYDMKFPCPEDNPATWDYYKEGDWAGLSQGRLYRRALKVKPYLVSPREGVAPDYEN